MAASNFNGTCIDKKLTVTGEIQMTFQPEATATLTSIGPIIITTDVATGATVDLADTLVFTINLP